MHLISYVPSNIQKYELEGMSLIISFLKTDRFPFLFLTREPIFNMQFYAAIP